MFSLPLLRIVISRSTKLYVESWSLHYCDSGPARYYSSCPKVDLFISRIFPEKCVVLLEDIDSAGVSRKTVDKVKDDVKGGGKCFKEKVLLLRSRRHASSAAQRP